MPYWHNLLNLSLKPEVITEEGSQSCHQSYLAFHLGSCTVAFISSRKGIGMGLQTLINCPTGGKGTACIFSRCGCKERQIFLEVGSMYTIRALNFWPSWKALFQSPDELSCRPLLDRECVWTCEYECGCECEYGCGAYLMPKFDAFELT